MRETSTTGKIGQAAKANAETLIATSARTAAARTVHERSQGKLTNQADKTAHGEDEADVDLRPLLGRQKYGDKGAKTGLNVRDKENAPVQASAAPRRDGASALSARNSSRLDFMEPGGLADCRSRGPLHGAAIMAWALANPPALLAHLVAARPSAKPRQAALGS